jgi:hypothetical protein
MTEKVVNLGERIQRILNTPHPEPEFSDVVRKAFYMLNETRDHINTYDDRCMKVALVTALEELGYIEAGASTLKASGAVLRHQDFLTEPPKLTAEEWSRILRARSSIQSTFPQGDGKAAEGEKEFLADVSRSNNEPPSKPPKGLSEEAIKACVARTLKERTYKPPEPLEAGEVRLSSAEFPDLHLYDPKGKPEIDPETNELWWPTKEHDGLVCVGLYRTSADAEAAAERLAGLLKAERGAGETWANSKGAFISAYDDLPRLEYHYCPRRKRYRLP